MVVFSKVNSIKTIKQAMVVNYMAMEICTSATFLKTKSMGKVPFTGLVYVIQLAQSKQTQKLNNFMEIGGVDFLMVKGNIKNRTVR